MATVNLRHALPQHLELIRVQMEKHATAYGLDFFPTLFELVDADQLHAIAAYGGFPTRYPHWRFGMEYEQLSKSYAYGLQKIYELVINNNPCYAYLLDSNAVTDHKLVMAHVFGHCDFFKNNEWFRHTNRKMMDEMANHGNRIRRYMDRVGMEEVERFIDLCLSVEDLIDIHSPFIRRRDEYNSSTLNPQQDESDDSAVRFQAKSYMDGFVNPAEKAAETTEIDLSDGPEQSFPKDPQRDVLLFLLENAPLKSWQADVLSIIRDEAYYFAPQGQTKIMNEGWATYWHSTIMTRHGIEPQDLICYADHCAGTLAGSQTRLNPYKVGVELFRNIEERWNKGQFGAEYEACENRDQLRDWDRKTGLGRDKIFEIRRVHNDLTFIDEFLTLEFCKEHKLFTFGLNEHSDDYEIETRKFKAVKSQLLWNLTNMGRPIIEVTNGNHRNRGELMLEHRYDSVELKLDYAGDTLANLYRLWGRPVHIATMLDDEEAVISYENPDDGPSIHVDGETIPLEERS